MTLKICNLSATKSAIDAEIRNWFCTKNVSLFIFRYNNIDKGYIFLARNDVTRDAVFNDTVMKMLISNLKSNISELCKIRAVYEIGSKPYSISEFDGLIPPNVSLDNAPLTYMPNARSIITYILAGYSAPINPNLISSWGYRAVF